MNILQWFLDWPFPIFAIALAVYGLIFIAMGLHFWYWKNTVDDVQEAKEFIGLGIPNVCFGVGLFLTAMNLNSMMAKVLNFIGVVSLVAIHSYNCLLRRKRRKGK